jgi:hypothetical protein
MTIAGGQRERVQSPSASFVAPALYMVALAFTAYGVHWFALGWVRLGRTDPRPQVGMSIAFLIISTLGIIVFFHAGNHAVGGLFIGLTGVYVGEFLANPADDAPKLSEPGQRLLGIFHIGTGSWLMCLTFAVGPDDLAELIAGSHR